MSVISATNLSRRFGSRWAYARVDLSVEPGERVLLIGANGSGKTTLMRTLSTLLPQTVGELRLFDLPVLQNLHLIRPKIGLISHQLGLYEDLSAIDNLRFFARMMERPLGVGDCEALLATVGLDARPDAIRRYSAGMRKRVSLAALKLKEPELMLLDEPFAALDPKGVEDVSAFISEMPGALIIASHQVERAAAICDRAVLLDSGQIRWQGPAEKAWDAWRKSQETMA